MSEQSTEYTLEHYHKIHQYVLDYQNGEPGSADKLIKAFDGFIWKFVNCIHLGIFPIENHCLRRFVSLYITDDSMKKQTNQYKFRPSVKEYMYETVKWIQNLFSQYSEAEIRHELIVILLIMAKKYKDMEKPSFHNYVEKCFHFEAFRGLGRLINDPLSRLSQEEYIDNMFVDTNVEKEFDDTLEEVVHDMALKNASIPVVKSTASPFDLDSLNTNWINGVTCSELFKKLTPFERKLLVMHYVEKKTDSDIAEQFGLCRATINRKRLAAKSKLISGVNSDMTA